MKIYVVGNSENKFLELNSIREKYFVNDKHDEDNIDYLNPWYCELTCLFYLWKNCTDDIVGLEHYRRYFVNDENNLLSEEEIKNILNKSDIICRKYTFDKNYFSNLKCPLFLKWWCASGNYKFIRDFIERLPIDMKKSYLQFINTTEEFCQCNMFICKKEIIDKYCQFLFDIFSTYTKETFIKKPRIYGYIAEYFFGFWLIYNNYNIYYNKAITFDKNLNKIEELF